MTERITSVQNEYIKKLCRLNTVSGRKETGLFLVEGPKLCNEILRSGWKIERCLVTDKAAEDFDLFPCGDQITYISDAVAKKLSTMDTPPGIFMVVEQKETSPEQSPKFILALDHIADPSNLGAILRSAEAFGANLIFMSDGCVDLFSSKVLRSAMGSLFRVGTKKGSLASFLKEKKGEGYQILGAGLNKNYQLLPEVSFSTPTVMIIGNESNGISSDIMDLCDNGVFIPMLGQNESLNAAVAASIILWEQSKWK